MNTNKLDRLLASLLLAGTLILSAATAQATTPTAFKTPEAAMEAFGAALGSDDEAAKEAILGKNFRAVIPPVGTEIRYKFLESWARSHKIEMDGDSTARIAVGDSGWTLPIPLVKTKAGWVFDMKAGKAEIIVRQIGRNELAVIAVAAAFIEAQREFAEKDRDGDGAREYARKIVSSPGKKDGLYWPDQAGQEQSPLGPLMASAANEPGKKHPGSYHGYRYRILTAQGPNAAGGARNYVVDGRMTGAFGLIMWPAIYGETGVMTFMVNQEGQVFETDLGRDTATKVKRLRSFNPGASWRKVDKP